MEQLDSKELSEYPITTELANKIITLFNQGLKQQNSAEEIWQQLRKEILTPALPFSLHLYLFKRLFPNWLQDPISAPAWIPDKSTISTANLAEVMATARIHNVHEFHAWSMHHYDKFWDLMIKKLNIIFKIPYQKISDFPDGVEKPSWLPGAKLNIADSCLNNPGDKIAIISGDEKGHIKKMTYSELEILSNRVANSLIKLKYAPGDAIAINMPMTATAVAIYIGILKMGGVIVSIADSFSPEEIATRLRISNAKGIFTQDFISRDGKKIPLYEKISAANAPFAIVLPCEEKLNVELRNKDLSWNDFLVTEHHFESHACEPMSRCNILFSSGTTGEPKAIPWNHTTAIKAASDGFLHQNIQSDDVVVWPTNLGWMMGPWLIFASFINHATIAIYEGVPKGHEFGKFVQDVKATILGVVPTLVAHWRQTKCMEGLDWRGIKLFTSTGECSNAEDMLYLMHLASYKPVIEYCGGTEIGGAYVSSTVLEKNYPSVFNTPVFGIDFILLDEHGVQAESGEVAIIPPSIGLSTELINADHHKVYFAKMPTTPTQPVLRRHGDQLAHYTNGFYSVLGRADDTMNLGGIKISSAEIERSLAGIDDIIETAAISVSPPGNGPSQLVIYAATLKNLDKNIIKDIMQKKINKSLNPLFKIEEVVFVKELPKTASNKIMRRVLRKEHSKLR